jgi:secondary thiamine-phosphate synthase enzyme
MKSYRKELHFHTKTRRAYLNITPQVETALAESRISEGLCLVNAMNITASVFINDDESGLHRDFERWLEKLAPEKPYDQYDHNGFKDNADAHLKRSVMG